MAVVNYTDREIPYTRSIEHRHFMKNCSAKHSIVSYEFPETWSIGQEPYYPIGDLKNSQLFEKYRQLAATSQEKIYFGGRLGNYKYFNMDQVMLSALDLAKQLLSNN